MSCEFCSFKRLTEYNAAGKRLRQVRKLLVYGSCVRDEHPEIFERVSEGRVSLSTCPEAEHINVVSLKLASILARVELEEVVVLTVDGSPHCVQLHHALEEALRITRSNVPVQHLVVEGGEVIAVSKEAVKAARYLSRVERLFKERKSF